MGTLHQANNSLHFTPGQQQFTHFTPGCDESDGVLFAVFVCPSVCLAVGFAAVIFCVCCSLLAGEVLNSLVSLQCCVEHWSLACQHVGSCCVAWVNSDHESLLSFLW